MCNGYQKTAQFRKIVKSDSFSNGFVTKQSLCLLVCFDLFLFPPCRCDPISQGSVHVNIGEIVQSVDFTIVMQAVYTLVVWVALVRAAPSVGTTLPDRAGVAVLPFSKCNIWPHTLKSVASLLPFCSTPVHSTHYQLSCNQP